MSENLTLSAKQRRAIEALLTCGAVSQAAIAAGVSRPTLYRWLHDANFQAALREAEKEAIEGLSRSLVTLGSKAASTLDGAMDTATDGVRVRAADVVLARLLQLKELVNLEGRVTALEKSQSEVEK